MTRTEEQTDFKTKVTLTGTVDEIMAEVMPRIRPQSREFYQEDIPKWLEKDGKTIVDVHAGCGIFYKLIRSD